MVILDPQKTDKEIEKINEELKQLFDDNGLAFLEEDIWGVRKLEHKIKGHMQGYYVVMNFEGEPAGLPVIHKELKLVVGLLRYMLVKMPEDYSLMRYDKPAPKKATAKLSAHAEELQKKVTKSAEKSEKKEEKPEEKVEEKTEAPAEEAPVEEKSEEKVETPAVEEATPVEEKSAEESETKKAEVHAEKEEKAKAEADSKLDEKLQAIIDDADIDL